MIKKILAGVVLALVLALAWTGNRLLDARQSLGEAIEECNTRVMTSVAAAEKAQREAIEAALRRQIEAIEMERLMDQQMREELQRRLRDNERELRVSNEELRKAQRENVSTDQCATVDVPRNVWVRVWPQRDSG